MMIFLNMHYFNKNIFLLVHKALFIQFNIYTIQCTYTYCLTPSVQIHRLQVLQGQMGFTCEFLQDCDFFLPPSKLKYVTLMFEGPALQIQALSWFYKKIRKTKMAMA